MPTSAEIRSTLIDALQLDLIGPRPTDTDYEEEVLSQSPSKWYLTGFLVPYEADMSQRSDDTGDDVLEQLGSNSAGDDETTPEAASARKALFPSSMGLSFLLPADAKELHVTVCWGDYFPLPSEEGATETGLQRLTSTPWQRKPNQVSLSIKLPLADQLTPSRPTPVPGSGGLELVLSARPVQGCSTLLKNHGLFPSSWSTNADPHPIPNATWRIFSRQD